MIAQRIRDFIDSLFPNRVVLLLRRQLEQERTTCEQRIADWKNRYGADIAYFEAGEAAYQKNLAEMRERHDADIQRLERERDYFRGRAERLELRLLPDPVARDKKINTGEPIRMGGRKTWAQVQRENAENIRRANEEAEHKKRETSERADAPKSLEVNDVHGT